MSVELKYNQDEFYPFEGLVYTKTYVNSEMLLHDTGYLSDH